MKYIIEFELPDNETVLKEIKTDRVNWSIWGYSGQAKAKPILIEQEAKRPVVRKKNGYWDYVCPICGSRDEELFREWKYCPYCGSEVKWK